MRGGPLLGTTPRGRRSTGRSEGDDGCESALAGLRSAVHQHPLQGLLLVQVFQGDLLGLDRMIYCTLSLQMQLNTFFKHLGQG